MAPAEFKSLLSSFGLKMPSSHTSLEFWTNNVQKTLDDASEAGLEYVVMPWLSPDQRKTVDDYKKISVILNDTSEKAKANGITIGYHNHDFEFIEIDGQRPIDILISELDTSVIFELDLYWITKIGQDPIAFFKNNPGRVQLWHVKDMANTEEKEFAPVGTGTIDFKSIFSNAKVSGLKYFFVEQDRSKGSPIDSIKTSYANILNL